MKILVTGGAGYIGSFIIRELRNKGFEVVVVDNLSSGHRQAIEGFKFYQIDIVSDREKLQKLFAQHKFDAVIHMASLIQVGESFKNPILYFNRNILGALNLLEAITLSGVKCFVFSSTAAVYGNPEKVPIPEDASKKPTNPYGESKLMIEKILDWADASHGIKSVSLRYFNAAGAALDGSVGENHPNESHLIPLLFSAIDTGEKFTVFGSDYETKDGTCVRDYIHVLDLASAHLRALEYLLRGGKTDQFNVGQGDGYSNKQIIEKIEELTGKKVNVEYGPRRQGDSAVLVASNEKIKKTFVWQPQYGLDEIITSAFKWHKRGEVVYEK